MSRIFLEWDLGRSHPDASENEFTDVDKAYEYVSSRRWKDGVYCPLCDEQERISVRKDGFYRCRSCSADFTVRSNTIFQRSKVPLNKWLYAIYLNATMSDLSSIHLHTVLGVTQKTSWLMLKRIRMAYGDGLDLPSDIGVMMDVMLDHILSYKLHDLPIDAIDEQPCRECGAKVGFRCSPDCPAPQA